MLTTSQHACALLLQLLLLALTVLAVACSVLEQDPSAAAPVCGSDGFTYYNAYVAAYNGVRVAAAAGPCARDPHRFAPAILLHQPRPRAPVDGDAPTAGAAGAGNASSTPRGPTRAELHALMDAFKHQGFAYVGRLHDAQQLQPTSGAAVPRVAPPAAAQPLRPRAPQRRSAAVALRCTAQGDLYMAKYGAVSGSEPSGAAAPPGGALPRGRAPPAARLHQLLRRPPVQQAAGGGGSGGRPRPAARRLAAILGGDARRPCSQVPAAVGELQFSLAGTSYVCSGALVSPLKVLTAAHCVYDLPTRTYAAGLRFSPGAARAANGSGLEPFGELASSHVTVLRRYLSPGGEASGDLAVVHLERGAPPGAGSLPLADGSCPDLPLRLTTAGYPVDKPLGSCWQDSCLVELDCDSGVGSHDCSTALGQSGSAMWDGGGRLRAVHVRGDHYYNEAITLTQEDVAAIKSW